jgi:hypothetical protein
VRLTLGIRRGHSIFKNGFEGTAAAFAAAAVPVPSAFKIVRYDAKALGAPTVDITFPTANATVSTATTDVVGTYTGDLNTGIVVNGIRAYAQNGQFLAPSVPLVEGASSLQATATTLDGQTGTDAISVTRSGLPALELKANVQKGLAPFRVRFAADASSIPGVVESVSVDFNGDATPDYTSPTLGALPSYTYAAPGLFVAQITVTSVGGQTTTAQRRVFIADIAEHRARLCTVFAHMRQGLAANDVPSTVLALSSQLRPRFTTFFNGLANRPAAAAAL